MSRQPIRFVPLACPRCGGDLAALEEDVAFCCRPCRVGLELQEDVLSPVGLLVIPHPAAHTGFHLPFWQFGRTRVPAFNTAEVVPMARRLSGRDLGEEEGAAPPIVGATLSSREARRVAEFSMEGDAVELRGAPALLAVPFLDEGNRLLEVATGYVLYKESIDRADALVQAARG